MLCVIVMYYIYVKSTVDFVVVVVVVVVLPELHIHDVPELHIRELLCVAMCIPKCGRVM